MLDDVVYDMSEGVGKTINNKIVSTFSSAKLSEINAGATLEYTRINLKAASSWTLLWDPIEHNGNSSVNCYAYSLSPIFRSLRETEYTVSKIVNDFNGAPGVSFDALRNYIKNEGFLCTSSSSGSMDVENVIISIYSNKKHILTGLTVLSESSTPKHFGTITGYSNINGTYIYLIYDPQHNGVNGKLSMPASTKKFTNSDNSEFIWNAGYITNIR